MTMFAESTVEEAAIDWLEELGYSYASGPKIAFAVIEIKYAGEAHRATIWAAGV
jgi:hypothetical protein